jgi:hypothetical protein
MPSKYTKKIAPNFGRHAGCRRFPQLGFEALDIHE